MSYIIDARHDDKVSAKRTSSNCWFAIDKSPVMDRLKVMEVFVTASDTGSFTAAAQALGMSPQMVGKYIVALEQRLATQLLQRTTRRQSLTEAGRLFYAQAKRILEDVEAVDADVLALGAEPRGTLRVTAPATLGAHCIVPALCHYLQANPHVSVDLTLTDRVVDIIEEGYDMAIRIGALPNSSLIARTLAPYEFIACASPGYLARRGSPTVPADLVGHECLRYTTTSNSPANTWRFTRDGVERVLEISGSLRINDARALVAATLAGCGIMYGPWMVLEAAIDEGRLAQVLSDYKGLSRPVTLLHPLDRQPTPKLRSFVDWAVDLLETKS